MNVPAWLDCRQAVEVARTCGTPTFLYALSQLRAYYSLLAESMTRACDRPVDVFYAIKANANPRVIEALDEVGAYFEASTPGELDRLLALGITPNRIHFSGHVSAPVKERLSSGRFLVSAAHRWQLSQLLGLSQPYLGVRLGHPDGISQHYPLRMAHRASPEGKPLGMRLEDIWSLLTDEPTIKKRLSFVHQHVGGRMGRPQLGAFQDSVRRIVGLANELRRAGCPMALVNLGGGMDCAGTVQEHKDLCQLYAKAVAQGVRDLDPEIQRIAIEPGRMVVAAAGVLLARIVGLEAGTGDRPMALFLDTGYCMLSEGMRYGWSYAVVNCSAGARKAPIQMCSVYGEIAEPRDCFAVAHPVVAPHVGDVVAILQAGAYGYSEHACFHLRPSPQECFVADAAATYSRRTPTKDALL